MKRLGCDLEVFFSKTYTLFCYVTTMPVQCTHVQHVFFTTFIIQDEIMGLLLYFLSNESAAVILCQYVSFLTLFFELFLHYKVENPSMPNDEGITPLHNAVCAGHHHIVKFLLDFGVNVNAADSDGWSVPPFSHEIRQ